MLIGIIPLADADWSRSQLPASPVLGMTWSHQHQMGLLKQLGYAKWYLDVFRQLIHP